MIDEKLEALLNEEIDGVTTEADSARIKKILESDPQALGLYQDLKRVSELLGRVPTVAPPPELKQNILRGIEPMARRRNVSQPVEDGGFQRFVAGIFQGFKPAYGLTFAGGAAFGLAIFFLVNQSPRMTPEAVTGTMSPPRAFEAMKVVETKPFTLPGTTGVLETRVARDQILARIEIDAAVRADVFVRFDPEHLRPRGVQVTDTPSGDISIQANEIHIAHQGGNTYWITFSQAGKEPADVRVRIASGGKTLEETVATSPETGRS